FNVSLATPKCSSFATITVGPYVPYQPPAPAAPSNLTLKIIGPLGHQIPTLQWTDNSSTEDRFEIEGLNAGGSFGVIGTANSNTTSYALLNDLYDLAGFPKYRVRACLLNVCSSESNEAP